MNELEQAGFFSFCVYDLRLLSFKDYLYYFLREPFEAEKAEFGVLTSGIVS